MGYNKEEIIFDLIASEADLCIYFDTETHRAEKPAIIITGNVVGHLPIDPKDKYTLWFGSGIGRWSFKTILGALGKAEEIMKTAKTPMIFRATGRMARRALRYAEMRGVVLG